MAEVRVQALEAQLDISGLFDPGSMAHAAYLELGGDGAGTVAPWPHDPWVELSAEPTGFVTIVAAENDEMERVLTRMEETCDEMIGGRSCRSGVDPSSRTRAICDVADAALLYGARVR